MFRRISWDKAGLAAAAGAVFVLAFIPFHLFPFIFVFPALFTLLTLRCTSFKEGFAYGFLTSFVVNAGGFYWVTYVIHVFGDLSWTVSALIYLLFCGFGALSLPTFSGIASWLHRRIPPERMSPSFAALWFTVALPAWFLLPEWAVPKLFPFYAGQCLYWLPVLTQIAEVTGSIFLSYAVFSVGGALALLWLARRDRQRFSPIAVVVPVSLWAIIVVFGVLRLRGPEPDGRTLTVALIQPNIGSLDKVAARRGLRERVKYVVDKYLSLTDEAMARTPRPELIVWPETAMPFHLTGLSPYAAQVRERAAQWGVPLITGGYVPDLKFHGRDYNGAYLLTGGTITDVYRKNILLAFGEYFPGGETFPVLYRLFPQVSNFGRGTEQKPFILADGTRLGITICYEAIVPSFYRRTVQHGVQAVVNLTNDSWFGPTSEPLHHGALATFRTVETRAPLLRVTNTGISFVVDSKGRMSETTGVYVEGVLTATVRLPSQPVDTFYLRYGDWFVVLSAGLALGLTALAFRRRADVPVPV